MLNREPHAFIIPQRTNLEIAKGGTMGVLREKAFVDPASWYVSPFDRGAANARTAPEASGGFHQARLPTFRLAAQQVAGFTFPESTKNPEQSRTQKGIQER